MTRTIRQSGTGTVTEIPDVVIAHLRIAHRAADVAGALAGAGDATRAVVAAVRAAGVASGDLATEGLSLQAVETGPWEDRRLDGYAATEQLMVRIANAAAAAHVLQAATTAAGDAARIDSVTFSVSDDAGPAAAARAAAFADARAKAEQFAQLAGCALGAVQSITDEHASRPPLSEMRASLQLKSDASGPALEAGERLVTAQVTVEWELV